MLAIVIKVKSAFVYYILFNVLCKCFYMGYVFKIDGKVIP